MTPIDAARVAAAAQPKPGALARMAQAARYLITGIAPDTWMSPNQPLQPQQQGILGRQLDFPVGYNLVSNPRNTEKTSFAQLRALADNCDLVRLAIETRKDQLAKLRWRIANVDPKKKGDDQRIQAFTALLKSPDRINTWQTWLRALIEELLVTDAPAIYPRRTVGGDMWGLELLDGATIKVLIDADGRRPMAPSPAYQQVIKGIPAVDYTADELLYLPRNVRVWKFYGFPPVEQILLTVNIALRRQMHQLQYYTEGNVPEALIGVPETWTPQQIKEFQDIWDALLAGNTGQRRHAKFVPATISKSYVQTKEEALKSEFDEWLARVVCYAFNLPPTPFIKQMNRATAETSQEAATEEGLAPLQEWVKDAVDLVITKVCGWTDLQFIWADERELDPKTQAEIQDLELRNCSKTINQVRAERGEDPVEGGDEPLVYTATGIMPLSIALERAKEPPEPPPGTVPPQGGSPGKAPGKDGADDEGKGKPVAKAAGSEQPETIDASGTTDVHQHAATVAQTVTETQLAEQIAAALGLSAEEVAQAIGPAIEAGQGEAAVVALVDQVALEGIAQVQPELLAALEANAKQGAEQGLMQLSIDAGAGMTEQVNGKAIEWAAQRAADLIKTDGTGGELVDATRALIRATVEQATREGWSTQQLAKALRDHYAFSPQRAQVIARTELAMAESQGNLQAYIASGVVQKKRWILDPDPCPVCIANAAQGDVPLLQAFQGGVMTAPQHPNCRCAIAPVID
jgi:SPP1 gp7 family putative phage head morphogenesis protein